MLNIDNIHSPMCKKPSLARWSTTLNPLPVLRELGVV
jgi:hypothetical protein